ncbi:MAG: ABC transporter ATP-binding protein/permease [Lachnospiraceae bacterium]|nr:ABC transporter ATP-binding protein/permease [Lachnospiraceae bacterium]
MDSTSKATASIPSRVTWVWTNLKGKRAFYCLGIMGSITFNVMQLTIPFFVAKLIDTFIDGENAAYNLEHNRNLFYFYIAAMVGLTLIRTMIVYGTGMIFESASQWFLYKIRNELYDKVQRQDMNFYNTYRTGDLMTRMTGDLDAVRHMIAWVIKTIIESVTLYAATMVYFFFMDWQLALILLIISPLIFIVILKFRKDVGPKHALLREKLSGLNTNAQENISGNRVVKAFAREKYEMEKFDQGNKEYSETNKKTALTWLKYYPAIETFANLMPIILLVVGGIFIINGRLTKGEFAAFSGLIWAIANPMRNLGSIMNEFQRFKAASAKVMEIYYSEPKIKDAPNAVDRPDRFKGKVEFKNVSFKYEDGKLPVLENLSFTVEPGETLAIMGETGCGKTSLIHLIPRFYEVTGGQVLVDGTDVRELKLQQLRKNIGLATQEVLLYSDTIDGNIAYGDDHLPKNEVVKFARYSAASDFIAKMPEGYDTIIGERGVGLSGGQKQRISLARALAIRPAILILDDTTSAVDMETEKEIQESLKHLDFPCTKIIIAQRISTTKNADKIMVLKDGHILEMGTHEELIEKKGYYRSIVDLQTGGEQ